MVGDWSGGIWVDILYRSGLKGRAKRQKRGRLECK